MAVTNYYSVNGRIRGESTGGVSTTYGADALGSVTGTYGQNGNPQNAYLYAPYGTLVQKTGTAQDPKFLWNGSSGYRNAAGNYSGFYVRARHYDSSTAQWTTVDRLRPLQNAFRYGDSSPANTVDPSGYLACKTTSAPTIVAIINGTPTTLPCGFSNWNAKWVPWPSQQNGWIVQHVQFDFAFATCGGGASTDLPHDYWEAWQVKGGYVFNCNGTVNPVDTFQTENFVPCKYGTNKVTGHSRFMQSLPPVSGGWNCKSLFYMSGYLWSTANTPTGWTDTNTLRKQLRIKFGCCCGSGQYTNCAAGPYIANPTPIVSGCT